MSEKNKADQGPEKVEGAPLFMESDVEMWMQEFCLENDIDNMKAESQNVFTAALMYIQKHMIPDKKLLRNQEVYNNGSCMLTTGNVYNNKILENLLAIYIYLCLKYDKEISLFGYSAISGISLFTLDEWAYNDRSSSRSVYIAKQLIKYRQESLSAKLTSGKGNPVGVLAILNRFYAWNMPGVTRETSTRVLTADQLPKLGTSDAPKINLLDVSCRKAKEEKNG